VLYDYGTLGGLLITRRLSLVQSVMVRRLVHCLMVCVDRVMRSGGSLHDYGHIDMLTHKDCAKDHFPAVKEWIWEHHASKRADS
jgi:hypothetical protein